MFDMKKAYISQAVYQAAYDIDTRIKYKQELADDAFGSFIQSQSHQTNLPDDFDPAQPRLLFQNSHKQLLISQTLCQLNLGFEPGHKSLREQLEIVFTNAREIHKRIQKFRKDTNLNESALIITLSLPSAESREALGEYLFSHSIKFPKFGEIASTSVKVGYLHPSNNFLNVEADVYEKRGGMVEGGQTIDLMSLPIVEQGVALKVDVNSRPKAQVEGYKNSGPDEIISIITQYFPEELLKLLNIGDEL
ncbi:hypothetical protein CCOS865_01852 [Pseudomonas reidholzensis]|uniref:Uncharacterized protein n=1 Tax=Pseudomonas reidholzensis TaxID=1785162 RepID=A0A383RTB3_9PSED|nr:hypothetical protein [Pseudomonas reidholzensis]SYX89598.1 hypothetical protein CCOS865_01852 [Pseudomonas reidholzensis]